jgi:anti-sigma regulatory factor (Ser/Thr protein kinase)
VTIGPSPNDRRLRLVLGNSLDSIAEGHAAIAAHLQGTDVDETARDRLDVVFEEVIANIVRHGFEAGAKHAILVELRKMDDAFELSVEDDGIPFNPLLVQPAERAACLADVQIGGLGIPLLRAYARSMKYQQIACDVRYPPFENGTRARNRLTLEIAGD